MYDYAQTEVIYITGFSHPKSEILKRIYQTAKKGTKVLIDDCGQHIQRIIYDVLAFDESQFETVNIKKIVNPCCFKQVVVLSVR